MLSKFMVATLASTALVSAATEDNCAGCISAGKNFCFQGTDAQAVAAGGTKPTSNCCADETCTESTDAAGGYTCSKAYGDADYALSMCPYEKSKCGDTQEAQFSTENTSQTVKASNLGAGESCTWTIKADCGSPAFKVKKANKYDSTNSEVTFVEYEKDNTKSKTDGGVKTDGNTNDKKTKQPDSKKPNRDQAWADMGSMDQPCTDAAKCESADQGANGKGKQYLPARKEDGKSTYKKTTSLENSWESKDGAGTAWTDDEKKKWEAGQGKSYSDSEKSSFEAKEKSEWSSKGKPPRGTYDFDKTKTADQKTSSTAESGGYGTPSKGKYVIDAQGTDQGYKTFGTTGQGASSWGTREASSSKCKERYMMVTVEATAAPLSSGGDQAAAAEVEVELGSYEFVEDLNSSAVNTGSLVNSEEGAGSLAVKMVAAVSMMLVASTW